MRVEHGHSKSHDASTAVAEATSGWSGDPQLIICFVSSVLDTDAVAKDLAERFPAAKIAGCTTAGEHLGDRHFNGSLAVAGVFDSSMRFSTRVLSGLASLDREASTTAVDAMLEEIGADRDNLEPSRHFAMLLVDGLSMAEERLTVLLADALEGIQFAGGSAGDDLAFEHTYVFTGEGAHEDAAVLLLASTGNARVRIFKHQHYLRTPRALCITKADVGRRLVQEIDGYPAIEAYAAAIGVEPADVTPELTFLNPITFSVNGEIYVRSVRSVDEDGSMSFYCGIEEGMVLEVGSRAEMVGQLERDLARFGEDFGRANLLIGFNCILRALEAGRDRLHDELGALLAQRADAVIGFDTYGEQLNGMHINQTLVALAISEEPGASDE